MCRIVGLNIGNTNAEFYADPFRGHDSVLKGFTKLGIDYTLVSMMSAEIMGDPAAAPSVSPGTGTSICSKFQYFYDIY